MPAGEGSDLLIPRREVTCTNSVLIFLSKIKYVKLNLELPLVCIFVTHCGI